MTKKRKKVPAKGEKRNVISAIVPNKKVLLKIPKKQRRNHTKSKRLVQSLNQAWIKKYH